MKLKELEISRVKVKEEQDRADALRAAFNADRQALLGKISELELQIKNIND